MDLLISLIPVIIAIGMIVATKKVILSLSVAVFAGALVAFQFDGIAS